MLLQLALLFRTTHKNLKSQLAVQNFKISLKSVFITFNYVITIKTVYLNVRRKVFKE